MIERYKPPEKKPASRKGDMKGKPLVRITYMPKHKAYLINEGPEQSEIRWVHNGNTLIVSNENIERI